MANLKFRVGEQVLLIRSLKSFTRQVPKGTKGRIVKIVPTGYRVAFHGYPKPIEVTSSILERAPFILPVVQTLATLYDMLTILHEKETGMFSIGRGDLTYVVAAKMLVENAGINKDQEKWQVKILDLLHIVPQAFFPLRGGLPTQFEELFFNIIPRGLTTFNPEFYQGLTERFTYRCTGPDKHIFFDNDPPFCSECHFPLEP